MLATIAHAADIAKSFGVIFAFIFQLLEANAQAAGNAILGLLAALSMNDEWMSAHASPDAANSAQGLRYVDAGA
jgi:hypothetical protein